MFSGALGAWNRPQWGVGTTRGWGSQGPAAPGRSGVSVALPAVFRLRVCGEGAAVPSPPGRCQERGPDRCWGTSVGPRVTQRVGVARVQGRAL